MHKKIVIAALIAFIVLLTNPTGVKAQENMFSEDIVPQSIVVVNQGETTRIAVKSQPKSNAKTLGYIYGSLMGIKVIKREDTYSFVETRDYDSTKIIKGYLPTKSLKTIRTRQDWAVIVDISLQKAYILKQKKVIKTFTVSTGLDKNNLFTPTGTYLIGSRGKSFYAPKYQEGAWNWVRFNKGYLFHSVVFDKNRKIIQSEAKKLGQKASHGCVRMSLDNSKWFYANIPAQTPVLIFDKAPRTDDKPAIPDNLGNNPNNILNEGVVAQNGQWIYYTNGEDQGKLYKVKTDGSNQTKLSDLTADNINVNGEWVYYTVKNIPEAGIYKTKIDGSTTVLLANGQSSNMLLNGQWIYYIGLEDNKVYRININGVNNTKINKTKIIAEPVKQFAIKNGFLYYLVENQAANLRKTKLESFGSSVNVLSNAKSFVISNDRIYYIYRETLKLYSIKFNGTGLSSVSRVPIKTKSYNVIGQWVIFNNLEDSNYLYKINISNGEIEKLITIPCDNVSIIDNNKIYIKNIDNSILYQMELN